MTPTRPGTTETPDTPGTPATGVLDLGPAARQVALLADGVRDDRLSDPTPCPAFAVRNLLAHLVGLSAAFRDAGRKAVGPSTATDPSAVVPDIGPGWRERLRLNLDAMAEVWRDPAAWDGTTQAGGFTLPAAQAGRIALNELVVHGWDLARATGQPYEPDPDAVEASYDLLAPAAHAPAAERGPFGPVVEVPADAPLLDRVVGLSGRDPSWAPVPPSASR
ncbi:TIGR03086 family metal-binding protein [Streptomyces sp. GC420]|uniref:TIGR03086 family metal-binding protein n=1 Tax=Streptomyces sp. GC420 TaxID=2697568 RepID=UPI001414FB41|nr:TIGR03086 family metal-binding protein [Streptomyces sp. GC420]NBM20857.1 TIGR03086 family protein [Streptomyces sp. GC420]